MRSGSRFVISWMAQRQSAYSRLDRDRSSPPVADRTADFHEAFSLRSASRSAFVSAVTVAACSRSSGPLVAAALPPEAPPVEPGDDPELGGTKIGAVGTGLGGGVGFTSSPSP